MNLIILGPQGSGKGTQAEKLARHFDLEHIDMGKSLREVAKLDTPLGREIYHIQNVTRTLVPSRILREVLHLKLASLSQERGIVFDGVPRTIDQAEYMEEALLEFGRQIDKVIFINVSQEESLKRISKRWICEACKSVFIMGKDVQSEKDTCSKCGGKLMQRIDDIEEGVRTRLEVYQKETIPMINKFYGKDKIIEINGEQVPEEVFQEILSKLEEN